jgi:hypothetical protein
MTCFKEFLPAFALSGCGNSDGRAANYPSGCDSNLGPQPCSTSVKDTCMMNCKDWKGIRLDVFLNFPLICVGSDPKELCQPMISRD